MQTVSSDDDRSQREQTPQKYVMTRNKRYRAEVSPSDFTSLRDEMRELFRSFTAAQKQELNEIKANLQAIQTTNSSIETSISVLASQNEEFQKRIDQLESEKKKDREYISALEEKIEDLHRLTRKNNIEIKNVPKRNPESKEDLIGMTLKLSSNINLGMVANDIKDIFRLEGKQGSKTSTIIVELGSTLLKNDLLKKTKSFNRKNRNKLQAKHLGHTVEENTPVFISEQLTPRGARLYFLARDLVKTKKYKYCWTSFGKVFVRRDDTSRVITIFNETQVHHLSQET